MQSSSEEQRQVNHSLLSEELSSGVEDCVVEM